MNDDASIRPARRFTAALAALALGVTALATAGHHRGAGGRAPAGS